MLPQYGAAHSLQPGTKAGGFDDENPRIPRVVGQKQKKRLHRGSNPQQRVGLRGLGPIHHLCHLLALRFKNRRKDVLLVAEVNVKAAH